MKAPVTTRGEEASSPGRSKTHTPVLPREEIKSNIQALSLFIPVAIKYIIRHVIIGTCFRIRRRYLKIVGRTFYL